MINRLRRKLAVVPGATLFMQSAQDLTIGGRMSQAQYQYTLQGENLDELNSWAPRLLAKLKKLPQLQDVNTDQQTHGLQAKISIDRDTAARLGVTAGGDRQRALRRLRAAPGLNHLPPAQPVSRGHGG